MLELLLQWLYIMLDQSDALALEAVYSRDFWQGLWLVILDTNSTLPGQCYGMLQDDVHHAFNVVTFVLNVLHDVYIGGSAHHFDYDCWE